LTIVALAVFVASTAATLGRISTWFGWGGAMVRRRPRSHCPSWRWASPSRRS
jgi:hypothetical protein